MRRWARQGAPIVALSVALLAGTCGSEATRITVTPPELRFDRAGATESIQAEALDRAGAKLPAAGITYRSRDPAIATVDSQGQVMAVGEGSTMIEVVVPGTSIMDFVHVLVRLPARVEVRPASATCNIGGTRQLKAQVVDRGGKAFDYAVVEWSSSDPAKATVDAEGEVVGIAEGEVAITAKAMGIEGTSAITVMWGPGQKALLEAERRAAARGGGGSGKRTGGGPAKTGSWDPRLSAFDD